MGRSSCIFGARSDRASSVQRQRPAPQQIMTKEESATGPVGFQGFPERPDGVDLMDHIRSVLEMAPPAFTTVWISDHLQFGADPVDEGWTKLAYLAAASTVHLRPVRLSAKATGTRHCWPRWPPPSSD